jgi:Ser/Thr protein kinase RdoA (MazF antagonist)
MAELLLGEALGRLATDELAKLGQWLGQIKVDAQSLDIAPNHLRRKKRSDVHPLGCTRMHAAHEHTGGRG